MKSLQEKIIIRLEKKILRLINISFLVTTVAIYSLLMPIKNQLFIPRTDVQYWLVSTNSLSERRERTSFVKHQLYYRHPICEIAADQSESLI